MFMFIMCSCFRSCHKKQNRHNIINQSIQHFIIMVRLTSTQSHETIGNLRYAPVSDITRFFGTARKTMRLLLARNRPRSGRPGVTTVVGERIIRTVHFRDRFRKAEHAARAFHVPLSKFTVRRCLRKHGIHCPRTVKRLHLQQRHMQAMLKWTNAHRWWTLRQREDVIFSDESRFCVRTT